MKWIARSTEHVVLQKGSSTATSPGHALLDAVALTLAVTTNGLTLRKVTPAQVRQKAACFKRELAVTRVEPAAHVLTKSAASLAASNPAMSASTLMRHARVLATVQQQRMGRACRHLGVVNMGHMSGHAYQVTMRLCALQGIQVLSMTHTGFHSMHLASLAWVTRLTLPKPTLL
jgi:hypothetical protein